MRWAWGEARLEAGVRASSPCGLWGATQGIWMSEKETLALVV